MNAAILAIGDELTLGQNVDTNSAWLAEQLLACSVIVTEHRTVSDERAAIAQAVAALSARSNLLLITGGLGPTEDDLTRFALGDVLTPHEALETDRDGLATVQRWFAGRDCPMPEGNVRQAMRPRTMRMVNNPHGTAPGLAGIHEGCAIFAMPGPPREMRPMFEQHVLPWLAEHGDAAAHPVCTMTVHAYGLGESHSEALLGDLTRRERNPLVGITASAGIIAAHIRAEGAQAMAEVEDVAAHVERLWGPYCFGRDGMVLSEAVGATLKQHRQTLAVAESCTGGLLGATLVNATGSSAYFLGGWIAYRNEMKTAQLGVPAELITTHGAVSPEVAQAMALGTLERSGATCSLAITGIAGPADESTAKPAGLVYIGLAMTSAPEPFIQVRRFHFRGGRDVVRDRTTKSALQMLRLALLGHADVGLLWEAPDGLARRIDGVQMSHTAYVGFGSNLGDRRAAIDAAVTALNATPGIRISAMSGIIETQPVGVTGQGLYLNAVAELATTLTPHELLDACLAIEATHGRDRAVEPRWGPRTIDLDVLLFDESIINEPGRLTVPHPRLHERQFVLEPLAEIAPSCVHPVLRLTATAMLERLGGDGDGHLGPSVEASPGNSYSGCREPADGW